MYEENQAEFVLRTVGDGGAHPVLAGVQAEGRLDGPLFVLLLRQTYRNLSGRALEVAYTFPLAHAAVLLGLAVEYGGRHLEGTMLARADAETRYEDALADGGLPLLLESAGSGLYSANIGHLQPGEQVVLELRTAQWLAFDNGRLRLAVPTTVAPRAGSPGAAGLAPHQWPLVSMEAEYPLQLRITVAGALASGSVACPTHPFSREKTADGVVLTLAAPAQLDRDVVLHVTPRLPRTSLLLTGEDSRGAGGDSGAGGHVALAAFQLPQGRPRPHIALKLLVDCSGSMAGDSIESAQLALMALGKQLRAGDAVGLSRFGSRFDEVMAPTRFNPDVAARLLALLAELRADMGGTDLQAALNALFVQPGVGEAGGADILLVTDGQVWGAGPLVRAACASGHRVFAIGVGSAPAEGVLRELAEATGGACEFVTPGEALHDAAQRMLARIRQQPWAGLAVAWGRDPAWQIGLPAGAFGGDTLLACAGFSGFAGPADTAAPGPARLTGRDALGVEVELARTEHAGTVVGDTLARMAAAQRLAGWAADADDAVARHLALDHQLLSRHTHCVLVHRRDGADTAGPPATLHRVGTMLGAGWGGLGTVRSDPAAPQMALGEPPATWAAAREPGRDSNRQAADSALLVRAATLRDAMHCVAEHLAGGGSLPGLLTHCAAYASNHAIEAAMHGVLRLRLSPAAAWLLLALWVAQRPAGHGDVGCATLLAKHAGFVDTDVRQQALALFEQRLGRYGSDGWEPASAQRPAGAARRSF